MKKNLNIVVHDLFNEIGHSRAMIEVIKVLSQEDIEHIHFICYTHDDLNKLFPSFKGKLSAHKVPFPNLKPFIIKSLFFQIYTHLYQYKLKLKNSTTITVGACSFIGDAVNVQFVHNLWSKLYFKINKLSFHKYVYKKILLSYLDICENLYYQIKRPQLICLSQFIADDLKSRYNYKSKDISTAYSSAAVRDFFPVEKSRQQILSELSEKYPQLQKIDKDRPILLFVGAFERKGLPSILKHIDHHQLIVIGKPEQGSKIDLKRYPNVTHVEHTKSINLFFNLCDCFVFPTAYEPFGLVVIEAYATGTNVIVTKDKVGASEILTVPEGVFFSDDSNIKSLMSNIKILSQEKRMQLHQARLKTLSQYSWEKAAQQWKKTLSS